MLGMRQTAAPQKQEVVLATRHEWSHLLSTGLEALRRERDMTQQDLADVSGLNVDTIGRIERGLVRTRLQHATLSALAAAFQCATLTQFWEVVQHTRHTASIKDGHTLIVDQRTRQLVEAFQELTPLQQQMAEAIIASMLVRIRAQRSGEEALCVVEPVPVPPRRRG